LYGKFKEQVKSANEKRKAQKDRQLRSQGSSKTLFFKLYSPRKGNFNLQEGPNENRFDILDLNPPISTKSNKITKNIFLNK